jgi:hypothetical protein
MRKLEKATGSTSLLQRAKAKITGSQD